MLIDRFFDRGRQFLGCRYPIMCGAMTWVSDPKLVTAIGNAGGFGLLAGGNAPLEILEEQIIETTQLSENPFGVNLITLAPVYKDQLELLYKLDNHLMEREEAQFEVEKFWVGALRDAVVDGDVQRGSLMAGQSVGLVDRIQPLQEIIAEMVDAAEAELQRLKKIVDDTGAV